MPSNWDKESVAFENPAARRNGGPYQQPTGSGMQPPYGFAGEGAAVRAGVEGGDGAGGRVVMTGAGPGSVVGRGSSKDSL